MAGHDDDARVHLNFSSFGVRGLVGYMAFDKVGSSSLRQAFSDRAESYGWPSQHNKMGMFGRHDICHTGTGARDALQGGQVHSVDGLPDGYI
jgi:hypothetical protein